MEEEGKIRCHCGKALLENKEATFDNFKTEALVCSKCNFTTLTRKQAEKYIKLKRLHDIVDKERKVIRVGNSLGIILPDKLKEFGLVLGKKVKISALDSRSIKLEF